MASISAGKLTSLMDKGVNYKGNFSSFSGWNGNTVLIVYLILVSMNNYSALPSLSFYHPVPFI
jgi:hypothetical protein